MNRFVSTCVLRMTLHSLVAQTLHSYKSQIQSSTAIQTLHTDTFYVQTIDSVSIVSAEAGLDWEVFDTLVAGGTLSFSDDKIFTTSRVGKQCLSIQLTSYDFNGELLDQYLFSDTTKILNRTVSYHNDHLYLAYVRYKTRSKYDVIIAKFDDKLNLVWESNIGDARIDPLKRVTD